MLQNIAKAVAFVCLAGCSGGWQTSYDAPQDPGVTRGWTVNSVMVTVPDELTTTEENSFTPDADIVWHGEPFGDRKVQVAKVMREGISQGARGLRGRQGVDFAVTLQEFHALTPRARSQAPSAVHNISYMIQVFDSRTGAPLTEPELIRADLEANVGEDAFWAIQEGESQKVRITRHLKDVTAGWLGIGPDPRRVFSSVGR